MTREWLAVYRHALTTVKYRRLTPAGRGALLHVWLLATTVTPEASWPSLDALRELLGLDGFDGSEVDELHRGGFLEADDDGRVWIHDWDDWQLAATRSAALAYEAARKRDWRREHPARKGDPPLPAPSPRTGPDITGHNRSPDASGRIGASDAPEPLTPAQVCESCGRPKSLRHRPGCPLR